MKESTDILEIGFTSLSPYIMPIKIIEQWEEKK